MDPESDWPLPDRRMFYGPAGAFVQQCEKHTEADPVALLASTLVYAGLLSAGNGYAIHAGNAWHPPLIMTNLIGRTAGARKGTATAPIEAAAVRAVPALGPCLAGGFGSGETMIDFLNDHEYALIQEDELGAMLRHAAQRGSVLGQTYRKAWDGRRLEARSRNKGQIVVTKYCVAAMGHITLPELRATLTSIDIYGGGVNRQLWVATKRSQVLADRGNVPEAIITGFAKTLKAIDALTGDWDVGLSYEDADASVPPAKQVPANIDDDEDNADVGSPVPPRWKEPEWSPGAEALWRKLYERHCAQDDKLGLLGHIITRGDVQMLRLALIYMNLDQVTTISQEHVTAAAAFWTYCRDTAAYAFGTSTGDTRLDKILAAIRLAGPEGLSQSAVRTDVLKSNSITGDAIESMLLALQPAIYSRPRKTEGRTATHWFLTPGGLLAPLLDPPEPSVRRVGRKRDAA
jgi:hypothetical protein